MGEMRGDYTGQWSLVQPTGISVTNTMITRAFDDEQHRPEREAVGTCGA
jgi:hypothetical protein